VIRILVAIVSELLGGHHQIRVLIYQGCRMVREFRANFRRLWEIAAWTISLDYDKDNM